MEEIETIDINNEIEECLIKAINVSIEFEHLTKKQLNITPTIGEFLACMEYKLKWVINDINKGYDALDEENKKIQIKARRYKGKPSSLTGPLLNKKFAVTYDYALLVLVNSNYELIKILKVGASQIREHFERFNNEREKQGKAKRKTMSVSQFESLANKLR